MFGCTYEVVVADDISIIYPKKIPAGWQVIFFSENYFKTLGFLFFIGAYPTCGGFGINQRGAYFIC